MKFHFYLLLAIANFSSPLLSFGQRDTVKNLDKVEIDTKYRPVLSDARRVESAPEMKDPEMSVPSLNYTFPDLRYKVNPAFTSIIAQDFRNPALPLIPNNFIKAGFGNYTTPLFHLELHNGKNKNYSYGLTARHLSSIAKPEPKSFIEDDILIHGSKNMNGNQVSAKMGYSRYGFHYYGYNYDLDTFTKDSVRQAFNTMFANIHYDNSKTAKKLKTGFDIDFYRFSSRNQNEIGYKASNKTGGKVGKGEFYLHTAFEGFMSGPDTFKYSRNFIDLNPVYKMHYKSVDLTMGVFSSIFLDSGIAPIKYYINPEFKLDYYVVPEKTKAYVGLRGELTKGSTKTLYGENNYLAGYQNIKNTYSPYVVFGGLKGKLNASFDYFIELSQQAITNLPLYLTDTFGLRNFIIDYEDGGLFKFKTSLNYNRFEKIKINTSFTYFSYTNLSVSHAFQRPDFEWNTFAFVKIGSKLSLQSSAYVIGNRYARVYLEEESEKLPIIADINISSNYQLNKKLSFFITLNNLTNQTYQRWFNYPTYGLNGIAGASYKF